MRVGISAAARAAIAAAIALGLAVGFLVDFIEAENSMGFHAPQEAARVLAHALDYARQGQRFLAGQPNEQIARRR